MTDTQPCDRTDLPDCPDMHCGCGFEAGEHPAWQQRMERIRADREALIHEREQRDVAPIGIFQPRPLTWEVATVPGPTLADRLKSAQPDAPQPRQSRCSGCYDSFSGPWCDNCDQWPCVCEEGT